MPGARKWWAQRPRGAARCPGRCGSCCCCFGPRLCARGEAVRQVGTWLHLPGRCLDAAKEGWAALRGGQGPRPWRLLSRGLCGTQRFQFSVCHAPRLSLPCPSVALPEPADLQGPTSYRVIQISSFANSSWAQNQGSEWLGDMQIHGWDADAGRAVFLKPWSKGNFSDEEMVELEEIIQVYLSGFILEVQDHAPEFQMQCESRPLGSGRGLPGPSLPLLQAAAPWELPPARPPALLLWSRCSL